MNGTVPQAVIDEAYERDPSSAAAEYGAMFRGRRDATHTRSSGRRDRAGTLRAGADLVAEIRRVCRSIRWLGDSMTLAIAHLDRQTKRVVVDAVRERRPPFSPDQVVDELARVARELRRQRGHRRSLRRRLAARAVGHGFEYRAGEKPKGDIYGELLPYLNAGRAELLDHRDRRRKQMALERRTATAAAILSIAPGGHDEIANAVAGAVVAADAHKPLVISAAVLAAAAKPTCIRARTGGSA